MKIAATGDALADSVRELGAHLGRAADPLAWVDKYPLGAAAVAVFAGWKLTDTALAPRSQGERPAPLAAAPSPPPGLWKTLSHMLMAELIAPLAVAQVRKIKNEMRSEPSSDDERAHEPPTDAGP